MPAIGKRSPDLIEGDKQYARYQKLSKADWADAYADLYRQVFGDLSEADTIITDAENRTHIMQANRRLVLEEGPETEDISAARGDAGFFGDDGGPDYAGRYGQRLAERRQRANAASIADGGWILYPDEY